MFKIQTKLGIPCYISVEGEKLKTEDIKEDFAYVITKDGCFIKKKNFLYEGFFKMDKLDFLGEAETKIKTIDFKIPYQLFLSIETFFKDIYEKHKSEVAVLLYYCIATKKWMYCVPEQIVGGASVSYDIAKGATYVTEDNLDVGLDVSPSGEWMQVGSIHSHASMSAFHSGVDDKDEFGFDGIHITIGGFNKPFHEYACRVMYGKSDFKKNLEDVVDCPTISGRRPGNLDVRVAEPEVKTVPAFNGGYVPHNQGGVWGGYGATYAQWDHSKRSIGFQKEKSNKKEYPYGNGVVFINEKEC